MALLQITLTNSDGLSLTVSRHVHSRTTAGENEARAQTEVEVNNDPFHKTYGPWRARNSLWLH